MSHFEQEPPKLEHYWRAVILFGRNVASYKFALAKALHEVSHHQKSLIRLDELAVPFSHHLCEHLKQVDKQTTSNSSQFLNHCRDYNRGDIAQEQLIEKTVQLGFVNVIDAFHNVHNEVLPKRFYEDARKTHQGIILTDEFYRLREQSQVADLLEETEARWRLVETAWDMNLPRNLVQIEYDQDVLFANNQLRRVNVTKAKAALNGYHEGRCFYCNSQINLESTQDNPAEVDHFFPHRLRQCDANKPIDGVANLVLSCVECNRGPQGKFDRLPHQDFLHKLYQRNESLIRSHHPLRETLICQTGIKPEKRLAFLRDAYQCVTQRHIASHGWRPKQVNLYLP